MLLYNSQTRKKEEFIPVEAGKIRMYVCGPTVYDQIHIGNARTFFAFDIIRRYLMHKGYELCFAQNVTDVDDKIIKRAHELHISPEELAKQYTEAFIEQMRRFNILDPDIRPKATHEIGPMIAMILELIKKGHAYESGGDVYFSVRSYQEYGNISGKELDDLLVGARIEANELKHDPLDFVLWKAAKEGEPFWDSPWGKGRPGWHTECSAMVHKYLGTPIDIHGGGSDLSFPHHENESAQACSCWEHKLANYWMHSGMLMVNGEKMSKSLGNFYTLKEVLDQYDPRALRLLMLQTHYRSGLDFSFERLAGSKNSLDRIESCLRNLEWHSAQHNDEKHVSQEVIVLKEQRCQTIKRFEAEMDDDFNTAGALAALFHLVNAINAYLDTQKPATQADLEELHACITSMEKLFAIFGIKLERVQQLVYPQELLTLAESYAQTLQEYQVFTEVEQAAEYVLELRARARREKNWTLADNIRDELKGIGLMIEDTAQGARVSSLS